MAGADQEGKPFKVYESSSKKAAEVVAAKYAGARGFAFLGPDGQPVPYPSD